jgi:AsmA protein
MTACNTDLGAHDMATRGAKRRFSTIALVLLAGLLLCGIAAPIIVSVGSNAISVATSNLSAAPRDSFVVTKPTMLGATRLVTIERGAVFPSDATGRALDAPLSQAQLASGSSRFVLENGVLHIQVSQDAAANESTSPILDAVAGARFEALLLRQATVHIALPDGRTEVMTKIDGEVANRRKSSLSLTGKGDWRGQRIEFDISVGVPADSRPGTTVPLKMSLKGGLLDLVFDGKAGFVGPTQLLGVVEFSAPNIRQLARWFGSPWPAGNGLRNLSGRGQLDWSGPAMAFNRATFLMDENEATGTLHLKFADLRPSIGGTLAMKILDLGRYFPSPTSVFPAVASSNWSAFLATDLSLPLAQHFDADLRLSADKVKFGPFQLGRSAAAVTVSQGRMLTDVGAFEFDGGRGSGQISADMTGAVPKFSLRGRLDDIDAARLSSSLLAHPVLSGRATITTDITGTGKTGDNLRLSSAGRVNVAIRNGGRFGVDLRSLAAAAQKRAVDGWGSAGRGQTAFDEFDGTFVLRSGALVADDVRARSGELSTVFSGIADLGANRLNLGVQQVPALPDTSKQAPGAPASLTLQIFGPWDKPTTRNEIDRERAAEPTSAILPPSRL